MNYLAHGRRFLDDPYMVAGTAVPDWLSVIDRKVRARSPSASKWVNDDDPRIASISRGIIQHHFDDNWFHQTDAFIKLNSRFSVQLRTMLASDTSMRPGFVGHIAVELLLDSILTERDGNLLERYYATLDEIDGELIQNVVNQISPRQTDQLAKLVPQFARVRFLYDYQDDASLWKRLNHVMQRVNLESLPREVVDWLADARQEVRQAADELLAGEQPTAAWIHYKNPLDSRPNRD